jgi:hypothetical protein
MNIKNATAKKRYERKVIDRFWSKVDLKDETECWNFKGAKNRYGYGLFKHNRFSYKAHRFAWILTYGEIPKNMCVCHKCDNRSCVNPSHLFVGTRQDNVRDMVKKNRHNHAHNYGELNGNHKLTTKNVLEIKIMIKNGHPPKTIAGIFGVHPSAIYKISYNENWSHIK